MDGFKKRLNESVQLKLSFSLSLAIVVVALLAGVFSFVNAFNEAHELQDDTLQQVALLFDRQTLAPDNPGGSRKPVRAQNTVGAPDNAEESRVIVQHLMDGGQNTEATHAGTLLPLPATLADGLHTLKISGQNLRVLVKTTAQAERIAVAQDTGVRDEIARDSALRTLLPLLVLVPVLLLVAGDLVRKMFRPIATLSMEIDQRAEQELHPVQEANLPVEVRPFVVAINRLLTRVTQSMDVQRRFVADAAHELRSPLTAMSLQAERLADSEMSAPAHERLATLQRGISRGRNLLDQLLTLAKVQTTGDLPTSAVSVQGIFRRVLEDLMPLAEARRIDIGVKNQDDALVWVSELDMIALVKNLVDNAIRYTPEGGQVDLSVAKAQGCAVLSIQDNGPGIALAERARIFDPFYRIVGTDQAGSGLGMSIVKAVSDRIGARIQLAFSDEAKGSGLCARILIPLVHGRHESGFTNL